MPTAMNTETCRACCRSMTFPSSCKSLHCPSCGVLNDLSTRVELKSASEYALEPKVVGKPIVEQEADDLAYEITSGTVFASLGIAVIFFILLSSFKARIGLGAIGFCSGMIGIVAAVHAFVMLLQRMEGRMPARDSWRIFVAESTIAAFLGIGFAIEYGAPKAGIIRLALHKVSGGTIGMEPERVAAEKEKAQATQKAANDAEVTNSITRQNESKRPKADLHAWSQADFLLVNPTHLAVGLRNDSSDRLPSFKVVCKAEGEEANIAKMIAWDAKMPIIASMQSLARRIFHDSPDHGAVSYDNANAIQDVLRPRQFLPQPATIISYYDRVNSMQRIGFAVNNEPDSFEFCSLIPTLSLAQADPTKPNALFVTEKIVRRERVRSGSEELDLNDISLRQNVDWLDYCIYQVIRSMTLTPKKDRNDPGIPFVFVDNVYADVDGWSSGDGAKRWGDHSGEGGLRDVRKEHGKRQDAADREAASGVRVRAARMVESMVGRLIEREEEFKRQEAHRERRESIEAEIRDLNDKIKVFKALIDEENRLTSDIRSRLALTGVRQIERSERAKFVLKTKVQGSAWLGRPTATDAMAMDLVSATHLLLTEIRPPQNRGQYQLSMRLVHVRTGEILWEGQSDRTTSSSWLSKLENGVSKRVMSPTPEVAITTRKTAAAGGRGGGEFTDTYGNAPMVGLSVTKGALNGRPVITSVQPIYRPSQGPVHVGRRFYGNPTGEPIVLGNIHGFSVHGIRVAHDSCVTGLRLVLTPTLGQSIEKTRLPETAWVGEFRRKAHTHIDGNGRQVLGIHGRHGHAVDSIGLLTSE